MKKLIVACCILFSTNLFALQGDSIESVVNKNIQKALKILSNETLNKEQKADKLYSMFDPLFSYQTMAKLSLRNHWKNLTQNEQEEITQQFVQKLKDSYINTLTQYKDEVIVIKKLEQIKNRIYLTTEIQSNGETYEVIYKFYQAAKDDWLIYDMNILGTSIVQSYMNQFGYEKKSYKELLGLLEKNSI